MGDSGIKSGGGLLLAAIIALLAQKCIHDRCAILKLQRLSCFRNVWNQRLVGDRKARSQQTTDKSIAQFNSKLKAKRRVKDVMSVKL